MDERERAAMAVPAQRDGKGSDANEEDCDLDAVKEFVTAWSDDLDDEMLSEESEWRARVGEVSMVSTDDSLRTEPRSRAHVGDPQSPSDAPITVHAETRRPGTPSARKQRVIEIRRLHEEYKELYETLLALREVAKASGSSRVEGNENASNQCLAMGATTSGWHVEARTQRRVLLRAESENRALKMEVKVQKDLARSLHRILMKRVADAATVRKCLHSIPPSPKWNLSSHLSDGRAVFARLLTETEAMVAKVDAVVQLLRAKVPLSTDNGSFREWEVKDGLVAAGAELACVELVDSEELPFPRAHVNRAIEAMYRVYDMDQVMRQSCTTSDDTIMSTTLFAYHNDDTGVVRSRMRQVVCSLANESHSVFVSTMLVDPLTEEWEPTEGVLAKMQEWRLVSTCAVNDGTTTLQQTFAILSPEITHHPYPYAKLWQRGLPSAIRVLNTGFTTTNRRIESLLLKQPQALQHDERHQHFKQEQHEENATHDRVECDKVLGKEIAIEHAWEERTQREKQERRQMEHLAMQIAMRAQPVACRVCGNQEEERSHMQQPRQRGAVLEPRELQSIRQMQARLTSTERMHRNAYSHAVEEISHLFDEQQEGDRVEEEAKPGLVANRHL